MTEGTDSIVEAPAAETPAVEAPAVETVETADWQADPLSTPTRTRDRVMLAALAGSLLLHMTPLAPLVIDYILDKAGVPRGQAQDDEAEQRLGDEKGKLDGVNVEIIDAQEYDRRYMSHTAGKATGAEDRPQVAPTPERPPVEPTPPEQQQAEQKQAEPKPAEPEPPKPETAEAREEPQDQPALEQQKPPPKPVEIVKTKPAQEAPALTDAEAEQLVRQAQSQFQSYADASSKASLAALGTASPAVREILRKLKQAMPRSKGDRGSLIVRILLTETGSVQALALVKSSGFKDLDNRVLASVRSTLVENRALKLKPNERQLQITYDYF